MLNHNLDPVPIASHRRQNGALQSALSAGALTYPAIRELGAWHQWVLYRIETVKAKPTKVPFQPNGRKASTTDANTWSTLDDVCRAYEAGGWDGIGFVFSENDPFVGVDIDKCRDPITGEIETWAREMIDSLDTYAEASPSGTGLHGIARGELPPGGRKRGPIEMYNRDRYFTITGNLLAGAPTTIEDRTQELATLHAETFPEKTKPSAVVRLHAAAPISLGDQKVLDLMRVEKNGSKFSDLYDGRWQDYGYPSQSEADEALVSKLAFYVGPNASQIDRLFRSSGLYRDKWDELRGAITYGAQTIDKALAGRTEFYTRPSSTSGNRHISPVPLNGHSGTVDTAAAVTVPSKGGRKAAPIAATTKPPPADRDARPHLTDIGNAERLINKHGSNLRYCHSWKTWLVWTGQRWEHDVTGEIDRRAKDTAVGIYAEASTAQDSDERKAIAKHATESEDARSIRSMIAMAQSAPEVIARPEQFDADPWLFNCANGTIDLRTGELREHRRDDLITKMSPVKYDPAAPLDGWNTFIDTVTGGDAEYANHLQRAFGYSLTGSTREEKMFFVHGPAGSAKSTTTDAVRSAMGDYASVADAEAFLARKHPGGPREDIARLAGARLVLSIEVDEGKRLAAGLVKQITGGDVVTARELYAKATEFRPQFKLWLVANDAPLVSHKDGGMWRRILRLPFEQAIPSDKQDAKLKERLRTPAIGGPAVLRWAVEGCLKWQKDGLQTPNLVRAATAEYQTNMDSYAGFVKEACTFDVQGITSSSALWAAFQDWVKEDRTRRPISQKELGTRLQASGCVMTRANRVRSWSGIILNDAPTQAKLSDHEGYQDDVNVTRVTHLPGKTTNLPSQRAYVREVTDSPGNASHASQIRAICGGILTIAKQHAWPSWRAPWGALLDSEAQWIAETGNPHRTVKELQDMLDLCIDLDRANEVTR